MFYLGIDLGGTNIAAGITDGEGKLLYKDSVPTLSGRPYQEIVRDMAELSEKVAAGAGVKLQDVHSIGIGSPGSLNPEKGTIIFAANLKFNNVPVREEMNRYLDLPVYLDNDANCAALAEVMAGAAKGAKHSVTMTLGTGVGSGIIIDGKIYSGFNYAGGEFGHSVIIMDGELCTCGRRGCLESYASVTALIRQTRQAAEENTASAIHSLVGGNLDQINGKTAFDAARMGDETGARVVRQYIRYVAEGAIDIINIFQPEVLVIGGGISKEGETLLGPLRSFVDEGVFTRPGVPKTAIKPALLGNDAGIVGAAMLGKRA